MSPPIQQHRQFAIATPLGQDVLVLNRMTLRERLSAPFEIDVELSSLDATVDHARVIGHPAAIRLELGRQGTRYFHGVVHRFVQVANEGGFARYRAGIVPWFWLLTRTSDCRVFQHRRALDIAEEVFAAARFGSEFYELRTAEAYPSRSYCVQYRETDFNFVSRLLESEGIYYWFDHAADGHRLVLADGIAASRPVPGYERLDFHSLGLGPARDREVVTDWTVEHAFQPVGFQLKDFDFKKPSDPLEGQHRVPRSHGMARFAVYDYPGDYFEGEEGKRRARLRLEELQARYETVQAVTSARGLAAGHVFELAGHPRPDQNRRYLITELTMAVDAGEFASGGTGEEFFSCQFAAIPADTQYRPPRVAPKPVVQGVQTATVVGPSGEELYVDDHARVKVQFHWDRYGKRDENSSCWVRVSQPWAGKGYGCMNIPRIGQEVIVEFLEGDPDRPIINGRVYNAESLPHPSNAGRDGKPDNAPPSAIPAAAMMTSFKSNSLGGSGGSNEITMNDEGGKEGLFLKAQKDEVHKVGNDREDTVSNNETRTIGNNREDTVGVNETRKVGADRSREVGGNESIKIGASRSETVGANQTENVGSNMSVTVGSNLVETVGIASAENVGAAKALSVGAGYQVTVGAAMNTSVALVQAEQIGLVKHTLVGVKYMIQCGSSSITLEAGGKITIEGTEFEFSSSGPVKINGSIVDIN